MRLQRDDPDAFNTMLAGLEGEDGIEAQRTQFCAPGWSEEDIEVAAVASFLREAQQKGSFMREETGVIGNSPDLPEGTTGESTELKSDREYWPDLDLQAVNDSLAEFFTAKEAEVGGPVAYPEWGVRRLIAHELLMWAGLIDPKVNADLLQTPGDRDVMDEDPDLNEAFDRLLRTHHLTEQFQILLDGFGFTAPRQDVS